MESETYVRAGKKVVPLRVIRDFLLAVTVLVLGFGLGYYYREGSLNRVLPSSGQMTKPTGLEREQLDFSLYWQVWDQLEQNYLEPEKIDYQKMIYGSIQGMAAALGDPYTVFLPPAENQTSNEDLNGEFDGVGIQLGYKQKTLAVMSPLDGHPAIKKGVRAGDLILHIKDESRGTDVDTMDMSLTEAVQLIRGKKGTEVTLTLYREEKGTFEVAIVRDTITIPGVELEFGQVVKGEWQKDEAGQIAYVRVRRFGDRTDDEWSTTISQVMARRQDLIGVVLDLRNNPGGYLQGAVDLASEFIPEGVVVQQQTKTETKPFKVSHRGRLVGMPTVVLINGGSASASEILAGALRDRLKVKLVGEKSFGKGTVQEVANLKSGAGLHTTVARWLLPSGDWIHESGLVPDVEVMLPDEEVATGSGTILDTQLVKAVEVLESE